MSVYLLTFLGPVKDVRVELQDLLKKCPKAFFAEKGPLSFEVSANYDFQKEINAMSHWRVQEIRVAA